MAGNRIPGPWRGGEEPALVGGGPPLDRPTFRPVRAGLAGLEPETTALASLRVSWNIDGKPFFPGPQDLLEELLKQLMQSTSVVELLDLIERLLGQASFAAGVVYGAGESVVLSVVELLDLLKTFVLAELYDKVNGVPAAGRSSLPGIAGRILNFAGAIWGRFVNELLKPAAEERDEIVREIAKIFEDPVAFFGSVADQYVDKYRLFKVLVADHSPQSQFAAGKLFGEILLEVILLFIAGAGAVKAAAKAPKLLKLAKRLKGKIERKPRKLLGNGDSPPQPPSQPPPQSRPKPQLKEAKPEADPPPAAAATPKKPSFAPGQSDGGPGKWGPPETGRNALGVDYQKQITGAPPGTEYKVPLSTRKGGVVDFDGFDPNRGVLLDAKDFNKWPPDSPPFLRNKAIDDLAKEAQDQLRAAQGTPIEWHVSTAQKAQEVADILADRGLDGIRVIHTPKN
ncbi:MAG: hypothetical protein IT162_18075 [Bryobacterales bacterium]|nr:hypothetical protein [Bryobacterales bacterium]